ncbi:MAG: pilus assembly protein PilM [Patescibacteria group bacterium]|nr:pilus assembly protein PilM [Patescibacteria group bacterium]
MAKRVAGIDISDRSIEVVSFLAKGSGIIEGAVRVELPPDIIARGDIQDFKGVMKVLSAMMDSLFGKKRGRIPVALSLPESVVYSKVFSLPTILDSEQSANALVIGASEEFPLNVGSDFAYDFVESGEFEGVRNFLYATAKNRSIIDYMRVIEAVNAEVVLVEPESAASSRSLISPDDSGSTMIADIGARTTMLVAFDGAGRQVVSAVVPVGGEIFTAEIERRLKLSMEEAEQLKIRTGFDEDAEGGRVLMILQKPFKEIVTEIKRTVDYVQQNRGQKISRLVLAGGTSLLPKIADYMALSFEGIRVTLGKPLENVAVSENALLPKNFNKESILYSTAIGLGQRAVATRGHPGLNLHPAHRRSDCGGWGPAPLRNVFNKISRLMPSRKKKSAAKKPATSKTPSKAEGKKTASSSAKVTGDKKKAAIKKKPTVKKKVVSKKAAPKKRPPKAVPELVVPEVEVQEEEVEAPAVPEVMEAAQPVEEPVEQVEEKVEEEAVEELDFEGLRGATPDNPERDFGMGVGELLGAAMPDEEEQVAVDVGQTAAAVEQVEGADEGERLSLESILSGKTADEPVREPVPTTESRSSKWKIVVPIVVFLLALVIIAAGAGLFRSLKGEGTSQKMLEAVMSLFGKDEKLIPYGPDVTPDDVPEAPAALTVNVLVTAGPPEEGLAIPVVQSRVIETDVVLEDTFQATGEAQAEGGRSVGTITIVNDLSRTFAFVARTRFLSSDGVLFRMSEPADIPANGTVDVEVYADETGPEGDVGPSDFTIPGLSVGLQESVYGRSSGAMTGGSGTVAAVTDDDIEEARSALMEKLFAEARENFKSMVSEGEVVLDDLITSREGESVYPEEGQIGGSFKVTMAVQFRALLVPQAEIADVLSGKISEVILAGDDPTDYELSEALYTVEAYDTTSDKAEIRAEAPLRKL